MFSEKKRTIGILIMGWIIITSCSIFILSYWIPRLAFPGNIEAFRIYNRTSPIVSKLIADPRNLFFVLEASDVIRSHSVTLYVSLLRTILLFICGYGLIKLKNYARMIVIIICWITILSAPLDAIYTFILWCSEKTTTALTVITVVKWSASLIFASVPHVIIPFAYIFYLTRLRVKEQFASLHKSKIGTDTYFY